MVPTPAALWLIHQISSHLPSAQRRRPVFIPSRGPSERFSAGDKSCALFKCSPSLSSVCSLQVCSGLRCTFFYRSSTLVIFFNRSIIPTFFSLPETLTFKFILEAALATFMRQHCERFSQFTLERDVCWIHVLCIFRVFLFCFACDNLTVELILSYW